MASAYAGLVSLMNTIDHIQNHPRLSVSLDKKQIESLLEKVRLWLDYIESTHSLGGSREEVLESQIAHAANAAEDEIESHVVDQIHSRSISLLDLQNKDMDYVIKKVVNLKDGRRLFKDLVGQKSSLQIIPTAAGAKKWNIVENIKRKVIKPIYSIHPRRRLKKIIEKMDLKIKKKMIEIKEKREFKDQSPTYSFPVTSPRPLNNGKNTTVGFEFDEMFIQSMDDIFGQQSNRTVGIDDIVKTTSAEGK